MPFLILTPAGLADTVPKASGAPVYLNPSLLSPAEIEQLRQQGAQVHLLASDVDPQDPKQVQDAVNYVAQAAGMPVWLEQPSPEIVEREEAPPSSPAEETPRPPPVRHLAETAGKLALQAFKRVGRSLGQGKPLMIVPYAGFGNAERLLVRGRVLETEKFRSQTATDSRWSNLLELYKRLESDEVGGAKVVARFQGAEHRTVSDDGGYFSFEIALATPLEASGWITVELELEEPGAGPVAATAEVLVPPPGARYGVISDIDDTVLWSNVTNKLNMLRMLARSNAHTRKPFKGVAALYRAFHAGASGTERNPIFYVSSSPWHLYGTLTEFFQLQGIPKGPLLLRELGVREVFGEGRHHTHKLDKIETIMRFYPGMQFILVGDSGERDPEIYSEVVRRHPTAVRAIYIRNVNPDPSRIDAIDKLVEEVRATGTQLILTADSVAAATHAAGEGLIDVAYIAAVREDKKVEEATPP
ncbi:MAG TPA: phosphatase domain-containing protein [Telluria sp.]|nr:phosphatase domain-containing protein [Telluria sp.]